MLQHVILNTGDAALIVNGRLILTGETADDSAKLVEAVAEDLALALDMPLQRVSRTVPDEPAEGEEDWTWEQVAASL